MKKYINKLIIFASILLVLGSLLIAFFCVPMLTADELWNFQNIYKMYNGFKIYNDSNVIITPLFFHIWNIIFKFFSPTFFTFRISNLLIILPFFIYMYKILKKLNLNTSINLLFITMTFFNTFYLFVSNGPNYNTLALLFFTIGLYYYLSNKNSNFLQGFILFLIFCTKQTVGLFYLLAIIVYELHKYKLSKNFFKNQLKKAISFIIPLLIVILAMYFNGNLYNCINYTFGGLLDFSKNNFDFSPKIYNFFIILLAYSLSIAILMSKNNLLKFGFEKNFFDNLIFLNIFATCALLILYPIFNHAHTLMVTPFFFIILAYIFNSIFKDFFESLKVQTCINAVSIIILLILFINVFFELVMPYTHINATFISDIKSPYFGLILFDETINQIDTLSEYIEYKNQYGTDVIICYYDSAYVMIPLKQSHCAYDLIFYGNLGYNGIEKMKQDILSREHTEFLILNNDNIKVNQFVIEIHDFIKQNLTKHGEILHYDIYSK